VLNELAAGHEVIVSRGELIEIGDGFRIPDIMARSGAILREVGTTNRTRIEDYREAVTERTRVILRVHPSNFHVTGFTARPKLSELTELARERGITLYEDLGSGCLVDLRPWGINEPVVADSLQAGVGVVTFSGDKLLGGPQAGIICGDGEMVGRCRGNPMFRALRCDKMVYSALEAALRHTLFCQWERIPALHMISMPAERIRERAEAFCQALEGISAEVIPGLSVIGGGATPDQALPTFLIAISSGDVPSLERTLRTGSPPVIARIEEGRLVLDLRTVAAGDEEPLHGRLMQAAGIYARSR
jgi:L-seryl-tRNA(Ser) seleniumtransferase